MQVYGLYGYQPIQCLHNYIYREMRVAGWKIAWFTTAITIGSLLLRSRRRQLLDAF